MVDLLSEVRTCDYSGENGDSEEPTAPDRGITEGVMEES